MLLNFLNWFLNITQGLGYWGVAILMTIESSFIPFPSEVVIPPAAFLASQGKMNLTLIIIAGVAGSIFGALINYILARYLGRPLVYRLAEYRLARWLGVSPENVARAEVYFFKNANSATFWGRLIPVIRQLVSLPAGFSRMPFGKFVFFTALGSAVWVSILAALGYLVGSNQALLQKYYQEISWGCLFIGILWIVWHIKKGRRRKQKNGVAPI